MSAWIDVDHVYLDYRTSQNNVFVYKCCKKKILLVFCVALLYESAGLSIQAVISQEQFNGLPLLLYKHMLLPETY